MSTGTHRWIMQLDVDAFYAAVARRDDPTLRDRPVVVGRRAGPGAVNGAEPAGRPPRPLRRPGRSLPARALWDRIAHIGKVVSQQCQNRIS